MTGGVNETEAGWYLYVWDIKTGKSRKAMFYRKLNGYREVHQRHAENSCRVICACVTERFKGGVNPWELI